MTESPDGPDRFGCGRIALTIFAALSLIVLLLLIVLGTDFGSSLQNWLRQQQAEPEAGPGEQVPEMSARYFGGGTTHASVSGALSISGDLALDTISSEVSNDGLAWLSFGTRTPGDPEILITFHEPENAVTVAQGDLHATAQDDACSFRVRVTPALISGTVSCADIPVFRDDEPAGTTSISVEFSAETASGDPGGGETDAPEE